MRRDAGDASIGRILLEHLPDDLFGHGLALYLVASIHRAEYAAVGQKAAGANEWSPRVRQPIRRPRWDRLGHDKQTFLYRFRGPKLPAKANVRNRRLLR